MEGEGGNKKQRIFKKFSYRGVDLDKLLDMSAADVCIYSFIFFCQDLFIF